MCLALGVFLYQSNIGKCRKCECGECPVTNDHDAIPICKPCGYRLRVEAKA